MARDEAKLSAAKKSYRNAKEMGRRLEEARWANVIGNILKKRGEYVEALKWFRVDYDISVDHLSQKQCIPACQSLGEVYLHLEHFKDALLYQEKHLQLAEDSNDLVEKQRANTQLGRTYHEMFLRSEDEHYSVRNAKKYFKAAMQLAQTIKENPPTKNCTFLKEYIDAHNNIGMLEFDLDNLEGAQKILTKGLEICDEEEVVEDDVVRSRLHHNLGNVYMALRIWDNAREHIEKDIMICKRIGYFHDEAKGYINLGGLHCRVQKYGEALLCYRKALDLAKSMEDELTLVRQIDQNIVTVKEAVTVMNELEKEEQNLKKLTRDMETARGKSRETNCLLQINASLDCLIEKSRTVLAWLKLCEFAKMKKKIASELCDKEKISDSFLVIGESYQNLRKFKKALKWYVKSWETYKAIGHLEGQALTKINVGNVLDSDDNWQGALEAFEESYRLAFKGNLLSVQLTAVENIHYSYMIRFDNVEEARRVQLLINQLKEQKNRELQIENVAEDWCSESDTQGSGHLSYGLSNSRCSLDIQKFKSSRSQSLANVEELKDDVPLISFIRSVKASRKIKSAGKQNISKSTVPPKKLSNLNTNEQTVVGRKRIRVLPSDDEDEMRNEVECLKSWPNELLAEDFSTSINSRSNAASPTAACKFQDVSALKCTTRSRNSANIEGSSSSCKSRTLNVATQKGNGFRASSADEGPIAASCSKTDILAPKNLLHSNAAANPFLTSDAKNNQRCITFKIEKDLINRSLLATDKLGIESMKGELACLYYLRLPMERRTEGLLPIVRNIKFDERVIESLDTIETLQQHMGKLLVASIGGWVQKRLIKLYIDCCLKLSETPNMKLLKKLYDLEVSDDEVTVSECQLQDLSITPLLNAVDAHKTVSILDLSHNLLGNSTMEKLQKILASSGQKYGGLTLDLHCNLFGPTALSQICESPLLFDRLEVLNISGNRITDACASYLSTILENCKALCSLNIERCSVTSRTIQKVADALNAGSLLEQLCIGYNPVYGSSISSLLVKLSTLKRFSNLNLNGLKLRKPAVDSLCQLAETLPLSVLMLRETGIGIDGALLLTESLFNGTQCFVNLDISFCQVTSNYVLELSTHSMVWGIHELNLSGNPIMQEGSNAVASMLLNSQCRLRVLVLQKCQLGLAAVLRIIKALPGNSFLEELNLADNANLGKQYSAQYDMRAKGGLGLAQPNLNISESSLAVSIPNEVNPAQQGSLNQLEVPDGEDDQVRDEAATSEINDSCTNTCQRKSLSTELQFIQILSTAIHMARNLRFLDLSNNGFSTQDAEILYSAWSRSRFGSARKHIKDQTIHLFVEGMKCCVKPCCRKN